MPREVASAYTGSNITLWIGNQLVTNAFGISYELSQNKRPIYGYNSMYFDAISTGQVVVLGQLYLTTTKPNYLSSFLQGLSPDPKIGTELSRSTRDYKNDKNVIQLKEIEKLNYYVENKDYSKLFNTKEVDPETLNLYQGQLIKKLNYPLFETFSSEARIGGQDKGIHKRKNLSMDDLYRARNGGSPADERMPDYDLYRPDQFSNSNIKSLDSLNIKIHYGDPKEGVVRQGQDNYSNGGILNYSESFTVQLLGVHFLGESTQIMADDQPAMEVYKFIARDKAFINRASQMIQSKD